MNSTFFPSRTETRPMIYAYEEDDGSFVIFGIYPGKLTQAKKAGIILS